MRDTRERAVRVRVRLTERPPRTFHGCDDIEGGLQRGAEILPGTTDDDGTLYFTCELRVRQHPTSGDPNFLGPFAFGTSRARFLYVSWTRATEGKWAMFRRLKVPLGGITWADVERASRSSSAVLEVTVPGIARDGGPACAMARIVSAWRVVAA